MTGSAESHFINYLYLVYLQQIFVMKKTISLLFISLFVFAGQATAQKIDLSKVDLNALLNETQLNTGIGDTMELHLWMPLEFWKVSMLQDPTLDKGQMNDFLKVLEPYTIVAVIDGKFGLFGSLTYEDPDTIRTKYNMMDKDGGLHAPLEEATLNSEVQVLLSMFKPMMSNMLGEMGENLQFFVFNNLDEQGDRIFSPYIEKSTRASYKGKIHNWKTPFGTLLEKKMCPIDNELHNGSWDYCPYHGGKLKKA
ncbi:MAG: hypothetical protein ACI8ZM_005127 [Crocinitomix sp.]